MVSEKKSEERYAFAGYVSSFYYALESLNTQVAAYVDAIVNLDYRYGDSTQDLKAMKPSEKEELKILCSDIRKLIHLTYIKFTSLSSKIPEFEQQKKDLKSAYENIIDDVVFYREKLDKYLLILNQAFMSGIGIEKIKKIADAYEFLSQERGGYAYENR